MNSSLNKGGPNIGEFVNTRRVFSALAILLLALLIPSASQPAATYVAPQSHDRYMATVVTPAPLDADKPSTEEVREWIARDMLANNPQHFQCREYPEGPQPSDLIPTANVTARVSFDHHTGQYETIKVDPRIVISYETRYETPGQTDREPTRNTPGAFPVDHYSWTLAPGVEMYGVFVRAVDTDGHVQWTSIDQPNLSQDRIHDFTAWRQDLQGRQLDVWIVATDTTNCRQDSNPLPADMWGNVLADDTYAYMFIM